MENGSPWATIGSGQVVRLGSPFRVAISSPEQSWRDEVIHKLNELASLPRGWDGYVAPPVSFDTAYFALTMLNGILPSGSPAPQIVPGSSGDLQMEWHGTQGDIELHIIRPNLVDGWFLDAKVDNGGVEQRFTSDFTLAASWIKAVTELELAAAAAA